MPPDMGPQFSQLLAYSGDTVIAMGPLGQDDTPPVGDYVEQMHAWIYQEVNLEADAVAIPTSTPVATQVFKQAGEDVLQKAGVCWMLPLRTITDTQAFQEGRAFAVAIAMFSNDASRRTYNAIPGKQGHVIWWGHPVQLLESPQAVDIATKDYAHDPGTAFAAITGILDALWDERPAATR